MIDLIPSLFRGSPSRASSAVPFLKSGFRVLTLCGLTLGSLGLSGLVLGCSDGSNSTNEKPSPKPTPAPDKTADAGPKEDILPWKPGLVWIYKVTDPSEGVSNKTTTIADEPEAVGRGPNADTMAYKVETKKRDGADQTISWQNRIGDLVVRYREQSYSAKTNELELEEMWDPYKLHIDESDKHTKHGAKWTQEYDEISVAITNGVEEPAVTAKRTDAWQVSSAEEDGVSVTVPAGTFDNVIVLQKVGPGGTKTYWYARGYGKVKETGSQTEELVSFSGHP